MSWNHGTYIHHHILLGVFALGLLIAVKHWIFLIAGFNMMSKEELSQFDVIKISRIVGALLMALSMLMLAVFYFYDDYGSMVLTGVIPSVLITAIVLIKVYWKDGEWMRKKKLIVFYCTGL